MKHILSKIAIIALAIHLWFANEELLTKTDSDVANWIWYIVALAYSVIGANAVLTTNKVLPIVAFAIMDGLAIHFKINPPVNYNLVIGWFYAIYTAYIILITWYMEQKKTIEPSINTAEKPKAEIESTPKPKAVENPEPKQLELPLEVVPSSEISYTKAMQTVKGYRNGYATAEEKETKIINYIKSLPENKVKEQLTSKVKLLYNIEIN